MDIPLNLPAGQQQKDFFDYFNASVFSQSEGWQGRAGVVESGGHYTSVSAAFELEGTTVDILWSFFRNESGEITHVSASPLEGGRRPRGWKELAHRFIIQVLNNAYSQRKSTFFSRDYLFFIGPNLDGEYWLPGFRFAPVLPNDDFPILNAERAVCIDHYVTAIDGLHAGRIARAAAKRYSARLSFLLEEGLHPQRDELRFVIPWLSAEEAKMTRAHTCFSDPAAPSTMPEKGVTCHFGKWAAALDERVRLASEMTSLPKEARKILKWADTTDLVTSEIFDRCVRLYQVALICGEFFPSVGLAYRVAAVEALAAAETDGKNFSDFMRRYAPNVSEINKLLQYLYKSGRSAHFHAGSFPMGEFSVQPGFQMLMDLDRLQLGFVHRTGFDLMRVAIVNWLRSKIPELSD